jgi:translation elongation factor EF-1beta
VILVTYDWAIINLDWPYWLALSDSFKEIFFSGAAAADDDDDDVDLFGSDEEEEEDEAAAKVRQDRLDAYAAKKAKKPALIAKTSVLLDCKPWDDETNMDDMLKEIKKIEMDGLLWGAHKLVPVGYGISKLQVMIVVEDIKVSIEELQEKICEIEDYVQSCDVAAMNKI